MNVNIGLDQQQLTQVTKILNLVLADEFVLYTKLRNFHWNVVGDNFLELHKFFETQYEQISEVKDEVAERIRYLGATAPGSLKEFLETTRLSEDTGKIRNGVEMLAALLEDHQQIIRQLREEAEKAEEIGDNGTNDFLIGLMEQHEKMAWMTRSFLGK